MQQKIKRDFKRLRGYRKIEDRSAFIAIKGKPIGLQTFPSDAKQNQDWQECELTYANESKIKKWMQWKLDGLLERLRLKRIP